jgi:hypothetical protein
MAERPLGVSLMLSMALQTYSIVIPLSRYAHISAVHPASFDKLRMRGNLGGIKNPPHPELVEGRMSSIPVTANN